MLDVIFCYGTLQLEEVFGRVTGVRPGARPACAPGYRRRRIRGECFPGIVPDEDESTAGVVYQGLRAAHLQRLDRFEGDYYRRCAVLVHTGEGERIRAWAYVLKPRNAVLLSGRDWDLEEFRQQHMPRFLARL